MIRIESISTIYAILRIGKHLHSVFVSAFSPVSVNVATNIFIDTYSGTIYGFANCIRQSRLSFVEATISMALQYTVFYTYLVKCHRILFVYFTNFYLYNICDVLALFERRRPIYGHIQYTNQHFK